MDVLFFSQQENKQPPSLSFGIVASSSNFSLVFATVFVAGVPKFSGPIITAKESSSFTTDKVITTMPDHST